MKKYRGDDEEVWRGRLLERAAQAKRDRYIHSLSVESSTRPPLGQKIIINRTINLVFEDEEQFKTAYRLCVTAFHEQWSFARLYNSLHYRGVLNVPGWKPLEEPKP